MALPRFLHLVDLAVVTVVAVAVFLPAREMHAGNAIKGDDAKQFAVALAEARTMARPGDGYAAEELARQLGAANLKDWALETAVRASERAKDSPTRWRALMAASVAYVHKLEVKPALDFAGRALAACELAREKGDAGACPSWEEVRMRLYHQHLDAGVKSGIDPRTDPAGFRAAGRSGLLNIYIGGRQDRPVDTGSASAGSSASPPPAP